MGVSAMASSCTRVAGRRTCRSANGSYPAPTRFLMAERHRKSREELRAYHRKWCAANREKKRAYQRKWYAANCEKKRADNRKKYAANREKIRAYQRKWCAANREKVLRDRRKWRAAHPEKVLRATRKFSWIRAQLRRMARDNGLWQQLEKEYGKRSVRHPAP